MVRNRHPFEGELARAKQSGRFRLWTGHGGEWVKRPLRSNAKYYRTDQVFLPVRPLLCVARVPSLAFANRVIARRTSNRLKVKKINAQGLTYDSQTGSWWLVTDF